LVSVLLIVGGSAWYKWQLSEARTRAEEQAAIAEQESERANQVSQFLITLFDAPDPQYARGADVTVREVLEAGIERVRNELEGQERLKADLLMTLGRVFNELGEFDKGGPLLEESVEIHRRLATEDTIPLATALYTQAQFAGFTGDLPHAAELFEEALETARKIETEKSLVLQTNFLNSLGIIRSRQNRFDESEALYDEAIAIRTRVYGAEHLETSVPVANYARLLTKLGRYEEALPMLEFSYRVALDELGPYHPWIAPRAINLGRTYQTLGRMSEAEGLLRVALDQDRHIYGDEHHYVASSLQNLAVLIYKEEDTDEAIGLLQQALRIEEQSLGSDHIDTNQTRSLLASYYVNEGRYDEAEALLETAKAALSKAFDDDHIYLADVARYRGRLYLLTDRSELAASELKASVEMFERLFGPQSERIPGTLFFLADAHSRMAENDKAIAAYTRGLNILETAGEAKAEHYSRLEELRSAAGGL
jgi:tetratricopeptide (TPR) repeat protein